MKLVWQLAKFNLIFNRIRIAFLSFISLLILVISYYLNDNSVQAGEDMLQYSFYAMFVVIIGKLNFRSNIMLDVKHMLSLPMSKREIVWAKSLADIVHYMPVYFVFIYGAVLAFPEYHFIAIFTLIHLILFLSNMIALNKRIDFARMQHSQSSFKNSFLYFNKHLDSMIFFFFMVVIISMIIGGFKENILIQEYFLIILAIILTFLSFNKTVKILADETLSYFMTKRDLTRIALKVAFIGIPTFLLYQAEPFLKKRIKNLKTTSSYVHNMNNEYEKISLKVDEQKLIMAITQNDDKEIETYLLTHKELPWDKEILGGYIPHLAAGSGNVKMLEEALKRKPEHIDMLGKYKKRTPLFTAVGNCHMNTTQFLIDRGAKLDIQDVNGDTPAIYAAKNKCFGAVLLLDQYGADFSIENEKKYTVYSFIEKMGFESFLQNQAKRSIASKQEADQKNQKTEDEETSEN